MDSPGKLLRNWLAGDELMKKLSKGELAWGNLLPASPAAASKHSPRRRRSSKRSSPKSASTRKTPSRTPPTPKAPHPSPWSSLPSTSTRILSKFETPGIRDPRDLRQYFPIELLRIRDSDVIAIVWDEHLLRQWKNERPTSYNEHMEYEKYTEYRLVHTLRQHRDMFEILAPKRDDEIVRIRFQRPRTPPVRLVRPDDIYKHFPVIVDRRRGHPGKDIRAIIIRGDFKRRHDRDQVARMTADLMRSLYASKSWTVLPPESDDELCRIEISHD